MLSNATVVEAPPDTTTAGEFYDLMMAFCCDRAKGNERHEILQGIAVWIDGKVYVQIKDLKKHLLVNGFTNYSSNKIAMVLSEIDGATKTYWNNVRGKNLHIWSIPESYFGTGTVAPREVPQFIEDQVL
jgi:hypothetical protein